MTDLERIKRREGWMNRWRFFLAMYPETLQVPLKLDREWLAGLMAEKCVGHEEDDYEARNGIEGTARQYKIQARNLAKVLSVTLTPEDVEKFERYGGGATCHRCGLRWYDHPEINDGIAKGLTITCDGDLIKL